MNNFILIKHNKHGMQKYSLDDKRFKYKFLAMVFSGVFLIMGLGFIMGTTVNFLNSDTTHVEQLQQVVNDSRTELKNHRELIQKDIDSITLQIGKLMAQSTRINALGSRLTQVAGIESEEFDFSKEPGIGGSQSELIGENNTPKDVFKNLLLLEATIEEQSQKLDLISQIIEHQDLIKRSTPTNMPLENGWISSHYGKRIDPFTGKKSKHLALDFSGKYNAEIYAAAEGIVTWSGTRGNYGKMVEIDHGNGFVTRYAHAKSLSVKVGQHVNRGQKIAIMGKSGRATSEHLHFEVLNNGQKVNPMTFIRAS